MARKNRKTVVTGIRLVRYAAEGKSVAQMEDGKTLFVSGAVPGDLAAVRITKNKKDYAEGKALQILEPSPDRIEPFCAHFDLCGGCKWQMLPYERQLEYKQIQITDQLHRIGNITLPPIAAIIGSTRTRNYRNKLEFTFCAQNYLPREVIVAAGTEPILRQPAVGFHAPGRFDKVVDIQHCHLQEAPTNRIKNFLRELARKEGYTFYDPQTRVGWLRNLIIRVTTTGEVMVNIIVREHQPELQTLLDRLLEEVPTITSLHYTINPKVNDAIYDLPVVTYKGKGYIEEHLDEFRFKISPKSFFQTNTRQAEQLYRVIRDFAALTGGEIVYDLYCGTGSISIFIAGLAGKVIGIESVPDAIDNAKENAAWNGLKNCHFFAGDVLQVADDIFFEQHGRPDLVVTDPPRAGMHPKLVTQLLKIGAARIIYVSCNPATQARDLQLLDARYQVTKIQPVDMFPHTHHIESVALLELRSQERATEAATHLRTWL